MELIQLYAVAAVATALVTLLFVFIPVLREAKAKGVSNALVESPIIACITYTCVTTLLAPFVISAVIYPPHAELFRVGLQRVIEQPDE